MSGFKPIESFLITDIETLKVITNPVRTQILVSLKSPQTVKRQYMWASVSYLIRFLIPYFWGICAFVFIMTQGGELKELFFPSDPGVETVDNLYAMPLFLGQILPPVLIGIISAGMVAAFMSTHDSYLLCWSSVLTQDVVARLGQASAKKGEK